MQQLLRFSILCLPLAVLGCGGIDPGKNDEPVEVSGSVTRNGKPLDGVVLNFQATGPGAQAIIPVKAGKYKGVVIPGTYTYYVNDGPRSGALRGVSKEWQAGSLERQVEITGPQTLHVKLN